MAGRHGEQINLIRSRNVMNRFFVLLAAVAMFGSSAFASDRASVDDAKAMATKAAAYLKDSGPEKAFPAFQAKDNADWHDRDLYVFVQDSKGTMVSHGTNGALIGKPMLALKDVDGKPFNVEIQAVKDTGWIEYKWQNPQTKAVEPKKAYVVRVGDYLVGVGAYVQ
jgi:signal transduction histidine kinase